MVKLKNGYYMVRDDSSLLINIIPGVILQII
jgi:hypothetical protein